MAHPQQQAFARALARFVGAKRRVGLPLRFLEVGSYDVNGSVRHHFNRPGDSYIGVDLVPGPGVDLIGNGADSRFPDEHFDVVLSFEVLEHDPRWERTLINMARMLKPGGILAFSRATLGRLEHGTARTNPNHSPGTQLTEGNYYKNLTLSDVAGVAGFLDTFEERVIHIEKSSRDLMFVGLKKSGSAQSGNRLAEFMNPVFKSLHKFAKRRWKLLDFPVRIGRLCLTEQNYQEFAYRYYKLIAPLRKALKFKK